jgi:hypothetical protein
MKIGAGWSIIYWEIIVFIEIDTYLVFLVDNSVSILEFLHDWSNGEYD